MFCLFDISIIFASNKKNIIMESPSKTIFHTIERTIKRYRKFSQKNISKVVDDITIDQKMVLHYLYEYPDLNQKEIAELVFRDNASLTRMIDIMVKKKYLNRLMNHQDRRRYKIEVTSKGKDILVKLPPVIASNRKKALDGLTKDELIQLEEILNKILLNLK
jgi:DNA-binding MarR family transcriptional regulator